MGEVTTIGWTDKTFNPWIGCSKVSCGCAHCYAAVRDSRYAGGIHWGKGAPRQRTSVNNWNEPRRWNKVAAPNYGMLRGMLVESASLTRPRVFCASLSDWLDDEVPTRWRTDLLGLIHDCPNLDWQLLTKRPENFRELLYRAKDLALNNDNRELSEWILAWMSDKPPANVWIGASVEDQENADLRIPQLIQIPARVRFLSCEPLLGPVNLGVLHYSQTGGPGAATKPYIDWVIAGGESGPGYRRMEGSWAHSLAEQCAAAGIPFFMKQDSGHFSGMRGGLPDALWARKEFPK